MFILSPNIRMELIAAGYIASSSISLDILGSIMEDTTVYMGHRELATAEELEDWDFDEQTARVPSFPASWNQNKRKLSDLMFPDAMGRSEWEQRTPALGLNEKSILVILKLHSASPDLLDVQRRRIFRYMRAHMLQQ
jgi:hypothetical protein